MRLLLAIVFGFVVALVLQKLYARIWLSLAVPLIAFMLFVAFDVFLVLGRAGDISGWFISVLFGAPLILAGAFGGIFTARRAGKSTEGGGYQ